MMITMHNESELGKKSVGFDLLGEEFGGDVARAVSVALEADAVFPCGKDSPAIFRNTLAASVRDIENDERGRLFQRFLRDGPYEREGPIPPELRGKRLTPEECATAITFVYSFMVSNNTYGFGYALGMNFRNPDGRREMLWPQDLDEIARGGQTANGCRIAGAGVEEVLKEGSCRFRCSMRYARKSGSASPGA